jgi:probable rRNA maturation factor
MDELRSAGVDEEFPSGMLGDIVLCPDFARKQALEAGRTLDGELAFLTTHGILHLLGHDHMTPEEYETMFALQDELLAKWDAA